MPDSHHDRDLSPTAPAFRSGRLGPAETAARHGSPVPEAITGGVSAIVVTYFTGEPLWACLTNALAAEAVDEIVVVDNGNPEAVSARLAALAAREPRLTVMSGHGNIGFARGCNLGAAAASGRDLLFLNPDLLLEPEAARLMAEAARLFARPTIVGGRLMDVDGREQRGARRDTLTLWNAMFGFLGLQALERFHPIFRSPHRERDPLPPGPSPMPVVSGALLLIARTDFAQVGGFDEGYFLHVEDIDLCRRVRDQGGTVAFHPFARGLHYGSTSQSRWEIVEGHKADGLTRYFLKFAKSPVERALAHMMGSVFRTLLFVRGKVLRMRRRG